MKFVSPVLTLLLVAGCATTDTDVRASTAQAPDSHGGAAMQLPPGVTQADMEAWGAAAALGKQHEWLARGTGRWTGTSTMWMSAEAPASTNPCNASISMLMDGRYQRCEYSGDMGEMGPFSGLGFQGFDNVSQKYVGTWMDNCGTGIMTGEGTLSADGKTLTWTYKANCPIQKKEITMREVQSWPTPDTMTLDMYGSDPHSGKEYHCMHIEMKRTSS